MTSARTATLLFAALALLAAALHPGVVDNVDSRIVLRTAERLLDAGTWSLGDVEGTYLASPEYGARGPDGSYQMKFGAGNALLDVPFVALGRAALAPVGLDARRAGEAGAAFASCLWFALAGVLVLRIARRTLPERAAVGAALLHSVASYGLVYGRSAYLETPLTALVLLATDAALAARDRPGDPRPAWILGGAAAGVLWVKHAAVLLLVATLPVLFLGDAARRRAGLRTALRASVPAAAGAAAWLALNHVRFGSPFDTGYAASARFDRPILAGIGELLASERGGWLFFAPAALVGLLALPRLARRDAGLAWGIVAACVVTFPLYAAFFSPFGGDAWGPRYLLPNAALLAVPAAGALAALLSAGGVRRALAAAVVTAGGALQAAPCVVSFTEVWTAVRTGGAAERMGPVAAHLAFGAAGSGGARDLSRFGGAPGWTPPDEQRGADWWPVRVARDVPRAATAARVAWIALACGSAAAGVLLARRLRRSP